MTLSKTAAILSRFGGMVAESHPHHIPWVLTDQARSFCKISTCKTGSNTCLDKPWRFGLIAVLMSAQRHSFDSTVLRAEQSGHMSWVCGEQQQQQQCFCSEAPCAVCPRARFTNRCQILTVFPMTQSVIQCTERALQNNISSPLSWLLTCSLSRSLCVYALQTMTHCVLFTLSTREFCPVSHWRHEPMFWKCHTSFHYFHSKRKS